MLSREYQRVLGLASEESQRLGHRDVETGHLLLGILDQEESLAASILHERGLSISTVRAELLGE